MFSIIAQVSNVSRQNAQHSPVSGWWHVEELSSVHIEPVHAKVIYFFFSQLLHQMGGLNYLFGTGKSRTVVCLF